MTVFVETDFEAAVQLEAAFNTSPGALAAADFFRCQTGFLFKRDQARYDRSKDKDNSASVLTTQRGRESSTWQVTGDLIPSGVTGTPTAPDMDQFFEAHFGSKFTCTAHTTTAAGSSGVTLNLTTGGGAASGIRTTGGDLIAIDVDATNGVEVRFVVSRAGDVVTLNAALTANPAAARNVYVGTTYSFSKAALKTLHLWQFLGGDNFREKAGGCIPRQFKLDIDWGQDTPVAKVTFSGTGAEIAPHSTSKPTAVVAGLPLLPSESKFFWGATKDCFINSLSFESDNGVELRNNTLCSSKPTAAKRTGNDGRFMPKLTVNLLRDTTTHEGYFDNADLLQSYGIIAQMGVAVGNIAAIYCPDWVPDADGTVIDGEVGITLSGRCYGVVGDDEVRFAII
jgi:hypothetical protein